MRKIKNVMNSPTSSIQIPIFGVLIQVILWPITIYFAIIPHSVSNEMITIMFEILFYISGTIMVLMPLGGLLGIFLSIRNIIKKEKRFLNVAALILNLIWLSLLIIFIMIIPVISQK